MFSLQYSITACALCDSDSTIYKLVLMTHGKEIKNPNGKDCKYLTIDYRPAEPDLWGIMHSKKKLDIDSITINKLFLISDTLTPDDHVLHLNRMYQTDPEVVIINKEDYNKKKFTAKNFWKRFWKVFPESAGQMFVSPISYNADCTKAILYFEIISHRLVGAGYLVTCYLDNNEWKIKDLIPVLEM